MDQVSYVKSKVTFEHWEKVIEDCQGSGKTNIAYCEENGINIKSYYYWLRKIRKQACKNIEYKLSADESKCEFAPVQPIVSYQHVTPTIKLQIGRISIEVEDGMSQETIINVLNGIRIIC